MDKINYELKVEGEISNDTFNEIPEDLKPNILLYLNLTYVISDEPLTAGDLAYKERNYQVACAAIDHMIKIDWLHKHKIRGDATLRNSTKSLGLFLSKLLKLIERCKTIEEGFRGIKSNQTVIECFEAVFLEFLIDGFTDIWLNLYTHHQYNRYEHFKHKKKFSRELLAICKLAQTYKRPDTIK